MEVFLGMPLDAAGAEPGLPDLDDRLVEPGTRHEMLDGELVHVPPADAPHAERQFQLCPLIEAHTGSEFKAACELLTRISRGDDVAPDVSVYPAARDPATGRRQLEQLAFEVVSTQSLGDAGRKAAKLVARGVRRVFAIDVERSRALEWSTALGTWSMLDSAGHIADPAFAVPLPIETLVHSARTDDAVARALVAKHNAVIEAVRAEDRAESRAEGRAEGKVEGRVEGLAEAILAMLLARGVPMSPVERERILGERDPARLGRWIARAVGGASVAELLSGP